MFNFIEQKKRNKQLYMFAIVVVTVLIGVLFYILNYYTQFYGDDYLYSFSFSTGERIESIGQIIDSQIEHYNNMNGRSITHTLAQFFLLIGDYAFNYINVFFFLLLIYLIYFHAFGTYKNFSLAKLSMIAMLLFLSCPAFGQSFLWITGASNYLYGILIILIFMIPYRLQFEGKKSENNFILNIVLAIVYFLFGTIAGWTNENTSVAMIVMIVGYIILYRIKSIKIYAWNVTGCIGGIVGCILILFSPGTLKRLDTAGGSGGIISWIKRMILYSCDLFDYLHLVILLLCVLCIVYWYQNQKQLSNQFLREICSFVKDCGVTIIYSFGFLASVYSMIISPQFPERAWSGPVVLSLIAVMSLSSLVDMSDKKIRVGKGLALGFVLILCFSTYFNTYFELKNINSFYEERVSIITTAISDGEKVIEIPNIYGGVSGYSCYGASGDLNSNSDEWPNYAIARYYEVDKIICGD